MKTAQNTRQEQVLNEEIKRVIKNLKIGKASGPDIIENKFLKLFMKSLLPVIEILFNGIIECEELPKQWYEAEIIILHKKRGQKKFR